MKTKLKNTSVNRVKQYYEDKDVINLLNQYKQLSTKYGDQKIIDMLDNDVLIPISLFSSRVGCIEVIVRYLVDVKKYDSETISEVLGRDIRVIRKAYKKSIDKSPAKLKHINDIKSEDNITIPLIIFKNKNLSMLESLVKYLKEAHNLKYSAIAVLLGRNQRTIWTVYNRACKKI
ncbi:hypothetical protein HN695_06460 [Candidatus Woesearchaeota archaeon]|jgi:hypothetical protein|nr:hypothetical protein [Candidatus Woesearchaeota archaeon]MBT6336112.1 hypothetical protein [Candidatus Woesearchaeota archaeon]MBT7927949.1 hypothetical protein [Candidatus Woesearchaeota archaeon]